MPAVRGLLRHDLSGKAVGRADGFEADILKDRHQRLCRVATKIARIAVDRKGLVRLDENYPARLQHASDLPRRDPRTLDMLKYAAADDKIDALLAKSIGERMDVAHNIHVEARFKIRHDEVRGGMTPIAMVRRPVGDTAHGAQLENRGVLRFRQELQEVVLAHSRSALATRMLNRPLLAVRKR